MDRCVEVVTYFCAVGTLLGKVGKSLDSHFGWIHIRYTGETVRTCQCYGGGWQLSDEIGFVLLLSHVLPCSKSFKFLIVGTY